MNSTMIFFLLPVVLMVVFTLINGRKKQQQEHTMLTGNRVPGQLVAVRRQAVGDTLPTVRSKVLYTDPQTGQQNLIHYIFDQYSNMPPSIYAVARGDSKFILEGRRDRMLREYGKELIAQGIAPDQVDSMVMQRAFEHDNLVPVVGGPIDDDGFLILPTPVDVDVYLDQSGGKIAPPAVSFGPGTPRF